MTDEIHPFCHRLLQETDTPRQPVRVQHQTRDIFAGLVRTWNLERASQQVEAGTNTWCPLRGTVQAFHLGECLGCSWYCSVPAPCLHCLWTDFEACRGDAVAAVTEALKDKMRQQEMDGT